MRVVPLLLFTAGLALASAPASAQSPAASRPAHKLAKPRKAAPPTPAPIGGINTPSTDFSKVERADDGSSGPNGPTFRPTMGAGGMGVGGSF